MSAEESNVRQWVRGPHLGRGSTATVSLATSTCTTFAVKSADLHSAAPLQREQRLLSSVPSSAHLISYLGFDLTYEGGNGGRTLFNLFLEYAPGGSLSDRIAGKGLKEEHEIGSYTRGVLMGLSHLHSLGVAHCDVKPRNVLLAADGSAKLADFGCARWVDPGAGPGEGHPAVAGTPLFLSPEAARGEEQGTAADVWAVGCTVIEMATGRPPWPHVHDAVSAVHRIGFSGETPEIPTWLSAEARGFLSKCLERDPRRRPTTHELLRHPFVTPVSSSSDGSPCNPETIWRSPKCVLDCDMWDSLEVEEEEGEEEEEEEETSAGTFDPSERIRQLTSWEGSEAYDEWMDGRDWITVRTVGCGDPRESTMGMDGGVACLLSNCGDNPRDLVVNTCHYDSNKICYCSYVLVSHPSAPYFFCLEKDNNVGRGVLRRVPQQVHTTTNNV